MKGRKQSRNTSRISSIRMWEQIDPVVAVASPFDGGNKPLRNEHDEMKPTRRKILFINVAAIVICTGLLINRAYICIERYLKDVWL